MRTHLGEIVLGFVRCYLPTNDYLPHIWTRKAAPPLKCAPRFHDSMLFGLVKLKDNILGSLLQRISYCVLSVLAADSQRLVRTVSVTHGILHAFHESLVQPYLDFPPCIQCDVAVELNAQSDDSLVTRGGLCHLIDSFKS
mmetsp:Transcript_11728/g.36178  ORF Transcript_11728/g.36178 Transcript_11728/m.36178 type:complete len:140 (+) Transcript_11728:1321-1740(+)